MTPVPDALLSALPSADLGPLIEALRLLPLRASTQLDSRLAGIRSELNAVLPRLWQSCLSQIDLELPLLILDEAHHAKNPWTRLAQLFASPEAAEDVSAQGPFNGVFSRMLFLTATPFQLGHRELIEVLRRFTGVRWTSPDGRVDYEQTLQTLETTLDDAQRSALRLEAAWSKLSPDDIGSAPLDLGGSTLSRPARQTRCHRGAFRPSSAKAAYCRACPPTLGDPTRPARQGCSAVDLRGRAITTDDPQERRGLEIEGESVLAFLLAARLQALIGAQAHLSNRRARAYFADGLASSFEAYRDTRRRTVGAVLDEGGALDEQPNTKETDWYMRHIDRLLAPSNNLGAHSKDQRHDRAGSTPLERRREGAHLLLLHRDRPSPARTHRARNANAPFSTWGWSGLVFEQRPPSTWPLDCSASRTASSSRLACRNRRSGSADGASRGVREGSR